MAGCGVKSLDDGVASVSAHAPDVPFLLVHDHRLALGHCHLGRGGCATGGRRGHMDGLASIKPGALVKGTL